MSVQVSTYFNGVLEPINQPRVCYHTFAATGTASGSLSGTSPAWVTDGETWSVWTADAATATLMLSFGQAVSIDYLGVAAHTLGSTGASVRPSFQTSSGGAFAYQDDVISHDPADDSAILWMMNRRSVWGVRFNISGGAAAASIAVAQAGQALEFPRLSRFTGQPISEGRMVRYRHQTSVRGDVIGRAVEGADLSFDLTISNLPEAFRADPAAISWKGFRSHIENTGPFFVAAKPFTYPDDVAYARVTDQPRFQRVIPNKWVSGEVTLQCMGYAEP